MTVVACSDSNDPYDPGGSSGDVVIADHAAVANFESIPTSTLDYIRDHYRIYYGHTSHGSQIVTGMALGSTTS
jgi:hypothetical protein